MESVGLLASGGGQRQSRRAQRLKKKCTRARGHTKGKRDSKSQKKRTMTVRPVATSTLNVPAAGTLSVTPVFCVESGGQHWESACVT